MTSLEHDHQIQNAINRWENEGGAVATYDRANESNIGNKEEIVQRPTSHSSSRRNSC